MKDNLEIKSDNDCNKKSKLALILSLIPYLLILYCMIGSFFEVYDGEVWLLCVMYGMSIGIPIYAISVAYAIKSISYAIKIKKISCCILSIISLIINSVPIVFWLYLIISIKFHF